MNQPSVEQLCQLVAEEAKTEAPNPESVRTIPLDPMAITYVVGDYWVKTLRDEPKYPNWTILHREHYSIDQIIRFNRKTADLKLHVPLPEPIAVGGRHEHSESPYLIMKSRPGVPLASLYAGGSRPSEQEEQTAMKSIGIFLARQHGVAAKGVGLLNEKGLGVHPGPWMKYFLLITEAQFKWLKQTGVAEENLVDRLADLAVEKKGVMIGETLCLVHNDLSFANILVDREEKKFGAFVNYGKSGSASPLVDITTFYIHSPNSDHFRIMTDAYQEQRSMPPHFEQRLAYYAMIFSSAAAGFFHQRGDKATSGYYMRRSLEAATELNDSFRSDASRFSQFDKPAYMK